MMTAKLTQLARKSVALLLGAFLFVLPMAEPLPAGPWPQTPNEDAIKARVRELQVKAPQVSIRLADGAKVEGRILGAEAESFTVRPKKTAQDVTLKYTQVAEIKKKSRFLSKAVLIPVIIGGGTLLLLCAGPYPIGFLCRADPS